MAYYNGKGLYLYRVLLLVVFAARFTSSKPPECTPGLSTEGYTVPRGDILIKHGDPLDITCILYDDYVAKQGQNASANLAFERNGSELPSSMVEILNSSAVRLHIENPPKSETMYTCKLRPTQPVCLNLVYVGTEPQNITDFECIGYNYDNLTCTWTAPDNIVKTEYNLTYRLKGRASRFANTNCPVMKYPENKSSGKMSCFWNVSTNPQYRPVHQNYTFTLTANNSFGTYVMNTTFEHFRHVLPGPPENLTCVSKTTSSLYLHWYIPASMQHFPPGLTHRVLYQCEYDSKDTWTLGGLFNGTNHREIFFNLTNIPYAHAYCDVRVSMRSAVAFPHDEHMWSKNSSITLKTSSTIPGAPPKTNVGSFEIVSVGNDLQQREAYVYWQQIPKEITNGPNFRYNVSVEGNPGLRPWEIHNAYARFKNLLISESYKFVIWSENDNGQSKEKSFVYVPKQVERVGEPPGFTKIAFGDGKYELTWERPKRVFYEEPITNYTVFWCNHNRDRPYQCDGLLQWVDLPNTSTVYNITVSEAEINQFAISTNTEMGSSGMLWAACTVIHNKNIGKMKNVQINRVGSTFIELSWKLDCSDRIGSVEGFIIYYCPIVSPSQRECKGPQKNITIYGDATLSRGNISDLQPYMTYMMTVAVITKHTTFSQQSDPLFNTTHEAAPSSPPLDVKVTDVTNSTIAVSWMTPHATNGHIKYYEIRYNDNPPIICDGDDTKKEFRYVLGNLTSYKTYRISMVACTTACSPPSDVITVTTKIGYPGKMEQPKVEFSNDSIIVIGWSPPNEPRGPNDFYELRIEGKLQHDNKSRPVINVTGTEFIIKDCYENQEFDTFYLSVRAVNLVNGKELKGPWSDELQSFCRAQSKYLIYVIIIVSSLILLASFFLVRKGCRRYKMMRNVEFKLPPGLTTSPVEMDLVPWDGTRMEDPDKHPLADEQSLLDKMDEGRHADSGHESVTSLESSTHMSSGSDSGIEQPHVPSTENSLRWRNVGKVSGVPVATESTVLPTWTTPGSYCVLGVDPSSADTPYVQAGPSQDVMKFPSISCDSAAGSYDLGGGLVKSANPGYVSYVTETGEKNPAYVVAGSKSMLLDPVKMAVPEKSMYVQVAESVPGAFKAVETDVGADKTGYVSIGEAVGAAKMAVEHKGYVPHRPLDAKMMKED